MGQWEFLGLLKWGRGFQTQRHAGIRIVHGRDPTRLVVRGRAALAGLGVRNFADIAQDRAADVGVRSVPTACGFQPILSGNFRRRCLREFPERGSREAKANESRAICGIPEMAAGKRPELDELVITPRLSGCVLQIPAKILFSVARDAFVCILPAHRSASNWPSVATGE